MNRASSAAAVDPALARLIVESAHDFAIFTIDRAGIVTSWNPGAENLLGWPREDAIGMDARVIFTPEDRASGVPENEISRSASEGRALDERWHVRRDGSRFWASGLVMPLREEERAEPRGFMKMMRDRTAEREADRRFRAVTAALPGFVFVADTDGKIVDTNERFRSYTGMTGEDLSGEGWLNALHPDDRERARELWNRFIGSGEPYTTQHRFRRHDGEDRSFACHAVPERAEDGRILRWLGTCMDVESEARARAALERLNLALEHQATQRDADLATAIETLEAEVIERRHAEEALRQAQKMDAVGQLTGGVAHDFNNLLTIIRSSVDLLRRPGLPEDKRRRYMDAISDTVDRAAALTRQLLAFARRQPLQPERFDAADRIEHIASMLRTTLGSRVALEVRIDCEDCAVEADPNQFDTTFLNLAVNARDAMAGEGRLAITVDEASAIPPRRGHPLEKGRFIAVSVSDSGPGIPPEQRDRIFEPFFTTKEVGKGTGLGLSQVIGFAKQSGGDVTVDGGKGEGATLTLYLPQASADQTKPVSPPVAPSEKSGTSRGCVLVVEDNHAVGEFAAQLLEDLGYSTMWAAGGQAALDLVEEGPQRIDLVFSDVMMPGMNGVDLAQRLRREHPRLPVVLTSGYSDVLAADGTHGFPLLHKPYSADSLSSILQEVHPGGRRTQAVEPR
jgi:PAS domain S-box-containing protein